MVGGGKVTLCLLVVNREWKKQKENGSHHKANESASYDKGFRDQVTERSR